MAEVGAHDFLGGGWFLALVLLGRMTLGGAFVFFLRCALLAPLARTGLPVFPGRGGADRWPFSVRPNVTAATDFVTPAPVTGFCMSDCLGKTVRPLWPCCWATGMLLGDR